MGGTAAHSSGDIFFAFATGNRGPRRESASFRIRMLSDTEITPFYDAVIESTEEAILNAMLAAGDHDRPRRQHRARARTGTACWRPCSGKPEPASFERAAAHRAALRPR